MVRSHSFVWILVSLLLLALAAPLQADITPSGDVDPTDYSWWTGGGDSSTWAYIGKTAAGSVTVNLGSDLSSWYGYIGYYSGSVGVVTVDGSGSTWANSGDLHAGFFNGQGTLNITNGGAVNVTRDTWVAKYNGTGEIHFDDGTLTTRTLCAGATQLTGIGTINTHGLVSDVNLLFDSAHGLNQTLILNSLPGQNIAINLTHDNTGYMGAGYAGNGTLAIRDGVSVESSEGYIGYKAGATGVVTVDGSGSTWTTSDNLYVGYSGQGTLNITNEGAVSNSSWGNYIGSWDGSIGVVTVDGSGSTWTCGGWLDVGSSGHGTLNITNGGAVSNSDGYIGRSSGSAGVVTVDGSGSTWTCGSSLYVGYSGQGTLNITNGGIVKVSGSLVLAQDSTLTANAGATIHMTGSAFQNKSTNSANLAGLGNLTMIFEGGTEDVDPFEAAGEDVGATIGGFVTANFLLDTLQLGGTAAGKIQLVDNFDNQADGSGVGEAVYVNTLIMNAGATIDLNELNLYYLNGGDPKQFFCGDATLDGYVDGGDLDILLADWGTGVPPANHRADLSGDFFVDGNDLDLILSDWGKGVPPPPVPEPVSATLLLLGAAAILKRRRK